MYAELLFMPTISISPSPQYSLKEEIANAVSHGFGAILSIIGLISLLSFPKNQELIRAFSFSIYGISLILMFLSSTCYHSISKPKLKQTFKLLDHCAIYLLIAGTYTPLMLITLNGVLGYTMLTLVWTVALGGILFKIKFGHQYKKTSLVTYLGMGFLSLPILSNISQSLPSEGVTLLALGGAIYSGGVFFYVKKTVPFTHAIWHLFVIGGATCHFMMMWYYV